MSRESPGQLTMNRLLVGIASLALSGCVASSEPDTTAGPPPEGLLTVTWSIDGTTDPTQCAVRGAGAVDIVVETPLRVVAAELVEPCEASVAQMALPPGAYYADITLLDRLDDPITPTVYLGRVRLYGADEHIIDADFPLNSLHGPP